MKLKDNIDYSLFLKCVHRCEGEVLLVTEEGDSLNLKSTLSQFVFVAALSGKVQFGNARVELANEDDLAILAEYLE